MIGQTESVNEVPLTQGYYERVSHTGANDDRCHFKKLHHQDMIYKHICILLFLSFWTKNQGTFYKVSLAAQIQIVCHCHSNSLWGRQRKLWSLLRCVMLWVTCAWHCDLGIHTNTMPCVFVLDQNRKRYSCLVHSPPQTHTAFDTRFWLSNDHQSVDLVCCCFLRSVSTS